MPAGDGKPDSRESDPARLAQWLEIEMIQKRAQWQQARSRRSGLRALSFFFLFAVVLAGLVGFFVLMKSDRVGHLRSDEPQREPATPTPAATASAR